jgi:hypothetical protein
LTKCDRLVQGLKASTQNIENSMADPQPPMNESDWFERANSSPALMTAEQKSRIQLRRRSATFHPDMLVRPVVFDCDFTYYFPTEKIVIKSLIPVACLEDRIFHPFLAEDNHGLGKQIAFYLPQSAFQFRQQRVAGHFSDSSRESGDPQKNVWKWQVSCPLQSPQQTAHRSP